MTYAKTIGRIRLEVDRAGSKPRDCRIIRMVCGSDPPVIGSIIWLSVEELRDLHYMIGRALAQQEGGE